MTTTGIIIKKELMSMSNSWTLYFGCILFFCVCGYVCWFSNSNLIYLGQASLLPLFDILKWAMFIFLPAFTMRSIADEKKARTLELLLTKPISVTSLIMGKFLAIFSVVLGCILLTLPYYITIAILGNDIEHGAIILGYIGIVILSACYTSIGIFASSISKTAASAFFIAIGIELCFLILFDSLAQITIAGTITDIFSYLSLNTHIEAMQRGILNTRDIIYFASIIIIFFSLAKLSINSIKNGKIR